jgi:formylmethanofuran dehydrogenase subunit E
MQQLRAKNEKTASEAERLKEVFAELKDLYMSLPLEELFSVSELPSRPPRPAVILGSLACAECGEMTMESRTRQWTGKTLCIPCFERVEQKK